MSAEDLYKEKLLDHYRYPRNRCDGPIDGADAIERGANPRCGDEIEIGIFLQGDRIQQTKFRGRGCAICIASASILTEAVTASSLTDTRALCDQVRAGFGNGEAASAAPLPEALEALAAVQHHPARKKCVLLSWEALAGAIDSVSSQ
jgi:nitrogen fixation NifU-like protein